MTHDFFAMKPASLPPPARDAASQPAQGGRPAARGAAPAQQKACADGPAVRHVSGEGAIGQDDRTAWLAMAALPGVALPPGPAPGQTDASIGPVSQRAAGDAGRGCQGWCGAPACSEACVRMIGGAHGLVPGAG
jgi:hypothetical protein